MDKLRAIEFFVKINEKGSFVDAAKHFGSSPSTISKAITRLEEALEVQLFVRTTRALKLTRAGQKYLETANKVLSDLEQSEAELKVDNESVLGALRINVPVSYGRLYIAPLLSAFYDKYPEILVEVIYDDAYIDIIENGIDITFRSGTLTDSRLVARKLSPIDFLICAPKGYFLGRKQPSELQSLLSERWISFRFKQTGKILPVMVDGKNGVTEYFCDDQCVVDDGEALAELCASGVGLAQMPHFIARNWIVDGSIEVLYPAYSPKDYGVFALYPKVDKTPAKVTAFIDFVQNWLSTIGENSLTTWARSIEK